MAAEFSFAEDPFDSATWTLPKAQCALPMLLIMSRVEKFVLLGLEIIAFRLFGFDGGD